MLDIVMHVYLCLKHMYVCIGFVCPCGGHRVGGAGATSVGGKTSGPALCQTQLVPAVFSWFQQLHCRVQLNPSEKLVARSSVKTRLGKVRKCHREREKEEGTERVVNIRGNTNLRGGGDALWQSRYPLWPVEDPIVE